MKLLFTILLLPACLLGQSWLQLSDFPGPERDDGVAVNVDQKLFFGSGLVVGWTLSKDFYCLDPATNSWTTIPPMPNGAERQYACAFPGSMSFFVFGGSGSSGTLNTLYKYSLRSGSWQQMASMPSLGTAGASCLEFGDKIIIAGGRPNDEVWEYTISTNTWLKKNDFPFGARFRASAAVINNTGYLMFGLDKNDGFKTAMYSYAPSNDTWTKLLDFSQPEGRAYASLKKIADKLILFGGFDNTNSYHKDVWYFDPVSVNWNQSQDFPASARKGGMAVVNGSKLYYSCGITNADSRLKETWLLDAPVGINHQKNDTEQFSVYPNPAKDVLTISIKNRATEHLHCVFTDLYGKEVKTETYQTEIDINDLKAGVYFLKISTADHYSEVRKIIKE